jgi:predicted DNA-binding transcriptional regulator YafY
MTIQGQSITLSLQKRDKQELQAIARELGITWGNKPNISKLIEAIARRQLLVLPNDDWTEQRITALNQARLALIDRGESEIALIIAQLLLERSESSIPLRQEIQSFVDKPHPLWRQEIDRYIFSQQPFQLNYRDAADRLWTFTIRHAQITFREKREYLDCWCEETEGNQDLPELHHNWCLRLDRIPDAMTKAIGQKWKPNLDTVEVEMHLYGGLTYAYNRKQADLVNEWLTDERQIKRIVRKVSNLFRFFRDIAPYYEDCLIISPDSVRDRHRQKIQSSIDRYVDKS